MDKLQMSLDDIIKMEHQNEQAGSSTEGNIKETNDFQNKPQNQNLEFKTSPTGGKQFSNKMNHWTNHCRPQGNYIGNRIGQWMPCMQWNSYHQMRGIPVPKRYPYKMMENQQMMRRRIRNAAQFLNFRNERRNGFLNYRNFNDYRFSRRPQHQNYSALTKEALYQFNRLNQGNGLRRSGSFSNLYHNGGFMRNGFRRAGSVSSLHSIHSNRSRRSNKSRCSKYSNRSRRSNMSNFSGRSRFSNHSLRSKDSNRSNHSNHSRKSNLSNRSVHSVKSENNFRNQHIPQKRHRFFLTWQIQRSIQIMQQKAKNINRNSPMVRDNCLETFAPIPFNTGVKITDRITANNA